MKGNVALFSASAGSIKLSNVCTPSTLLYVPPKQLDLVMHRHKAKPGSDPNVPAGHLWQSKMLELPVSFT